VWGKRNQIVMKCCSLVDLLDIITWARITKGRGTSPAEFGVGTIMQIVSFQILSYTYKMERSVALKIRQNTFPAGVLPRTPLGAQDAPSGPLVGGEGHTPPHTPPHWAPIHLWRSPCVPLEFPPDLRLCKIIQADFGHYRCRQFFSVVLYFTLFLSIFVVVLTALWQHLASM